MYMGDLGFLTEYGWAAPLCDSLNLKRASTNTRLRLILKHPDLIILLVLIITHSTPSRASYLNSLL